MVTNILVPAEPEVAKQEKASRDHNQRQHGTAQSTHFSHPLSQSYWFKFSSSYGKATLSDCHFCMSIV